MEKICTVIVTFNRLDFLKNAVCALKEQSLISDILVVNNGSTDGTREWLDAQNDIIVINQENVGGAGGFHVGMKFAVEKGYDFCWVMDDDVEPYPDALEKLYSFYEEQSKIENIGFLCSTVVDSDGNLANVPTVNERRNELGHPNWNRFLTKGVVGVSSATFVSVFFPCKVISELGLPYKEFFIWGDDTEYTNRISLKYSCYLVGASIVRHFRPGGAINLITLTDKRRIQMYKYSIRNNWYNNKQGFYDKKDVLTNYLWHLSIILRLISRGKLRKVGIVIRGIVEGIKFKPQIVFPKNLSNNK